MHLLFLQVEDANDNAPEFVNLPYYALVQVEAEPGSAIFTATALDQDSGLNGEVTYSLREQHRNFQVQFPDLKSFLFKVYLLFCAHKLFLIFFTGEPYHWRADPKERL